MSKIDKDNVKLRLNAIAKLLESGSKHLGEIHKSIEEGYSQYAHFNPNEKSPYVLNVELLGMHIRFRVEVTFANDNSIGSLAAYGVSADGKTETQLKRYGLDGDEFNVHTEGDNSIKNELVFTGLVVHLLTKAGIKFTTQ